MGLTSEERLALFNQFGQKHNYIGAAVLDLLEHREQSVVLQHIGVKGEQPKKYTDAQKAQRRKQKSQRKVKQGRIQTKQEKLAKAKDDDEWKETATEIIDEYEGSMASSIASYLSKLNWKLLLKTNPPDFVNDLIEAATNLANVTSGTVSSTFAKATLQGRKLWDYLINWIPKSQLPQSVLQFESEMENTWIAFAKNKLVSLSAFVGNYIIKFAQAIGSALLLIVNAFVDLAEYAFKTCTQGLAELGTFFIIAHDGNPLRVPVFKVTKLFLTVFEYGQTITMLAHENAQALLPYLVPMMEKIIKFSEWLKRNLGGVVQLVQKLRTYLKDNCPTISKWFSSGTFEFFRQFCEDAIAFTLKWYVFQPTYSAITFQSFLAMAPQVMEASLKNLALPNVEGKSGIPNIEEEMFKAERLLKTASKEERKKLGQLQNQVDVYKNMQKNMEKHKKKRAQQNPENILPQRFEAARIKAVISAKMLLGREDLVSMDELDYPVQVEEGAPSYEAFYASRSMIAELLRRERTEFRNSEKVGLYIPGIGETKKRVGRYPFIGYWWDQSNATAYVNARKQALGIDKIQETALPMSYSQIYTLRQEAEQKAKYDQNFVELARVLENIEVDMQNYRNVLTLLVGGLLIVTIWWGVTSWLEDKKQFELNVTLNELERKLIPDDSGEMSFRRHLFKQFREEQNELFKEQRNATIPAGDPIIYSKQTFVEFMSRKVVAYTTEYDYAARDKLLQPPARETWAQSRVEAFLDEYEALLVADSDVSLRNYFSELRAPTTGQDCSDEPSDYGSTLWNLFSNKTPTMGTNICKMEAYNRLISLFDEKVTSFKLDCGALLKPGFIVGALGALSDFTGFTALTQSVISKVSSTFDWATVALENPEVRNDLIRQAALSGDQASFVVIAGLIQNALLLGVSALLIIGTVFSIIVSAIVSLILQDKGGKNQSQLSMLKYGLKSFTEIFEVMRVILYPLVGNMIFNTITITAAKGTIMARRISSAVTVVLAIVAFAYFFFGGTIALIKSGFNSIVGLFKEVPKQQLAQEVSYFQGLQRAFAEVETVEVVKEKPKAKIVKNKKVTQRPIVVKRTKEEERSLEETLKYMREQGF